MILNAQRIIHVNRDQFDRQQSEKGHLIILSMSETEMSTEDESH